MLRSASNYTHHIDHTANFSMICVVLLNTLDNMVIPELGKIRVVDVPVAIRSINNIGIPSSTGVSSFLKRVNTNEFR